MNSRTLAPEGATVARLSANQAEQLRQKVIASGKRALNGLCAAQDTGESGDAGGRICADAWAMQRIWLEQVEASDLTSDSAGSWLNDLYSIESLVDGAIAIEKDSPRGVTLEAVRNNLEDAAKRLDRGDLPEGEDYYRELFHRGMRMCWGMLDKLRERQGAAEFEAKLRDQGEKQYTEPVEDCIQTLRHGHGLEQGFAAALAGVLAQSINGSIADVGYLRRLSYEDWWGAPTSGDEQREPPMRAPHSVDAPEDNSLVSNFMQGKALVADMIAHAIRISCEEGSDRAELDIAYRGRGVAQDVFVRPYFEQVVSRPELLDGFLAALSCTLSAAGSANEDPDTMRSLNYDQCTGGPGADYTIEGEPDGDETIDSDDIPPKPVFTDPAEIELDQVIDRLDGWLEGTEHTGTGSPDKAFDLMHKLAWGAFYDAQRALYTGAGVEATKTHLRRLRDALQLVREELDPCEARWPAVAKSLELLDAVVNEPTCELSPRREIERDASLFIQRLCQYFMVATHPGQFSDLQALEKAAGVILSSAVDGEANFDELRSELAAATALASVQLKDQPTSAHESGAAAAARPEIALQHMAH